jgi:glycerol-3-phosphate cytidylyltransferase
MNGDHQNVLVVGVFDLFHRGHVELLRNARSLGDRLVVVVNGDAFTAAYKRKPVMREEDRLEIVKSCKYVDHALISNIADVKPHVDAFRIRCIVHGDDWPHEAYLKQICIDEAYVRQRALRLHYTPYYAQESTSKIIERIAAERQA